MIPKIITKEFLDQNPQYIFVFGDNLLHKGLGGAAKLRYHPQAYGFVTKKAPNNRDESFYTVDEYIDVMSHEFIKLVRHIESHPGKIYLISKLGGGLANKYDIRSYIEPIMRSLTKYPGIEGRSILLP